MLKILPQIRNFIKKETLAQVFSCEFCEIFQNIFFTEHLRRLLLFCALLECKGTPLERYLT